MVHPGFLVGGTRRDQVLCQNVCEFVPEEWDARVNKNIYLMRRDGGITVTQTLTVLRY